MIRTWSVALATMLAGLTGCAAPPTDYDRLLGDVPAHLVEMAAMSIPEPTAPVSDFSAMRTALPSFQLERRAAGSKPQPEISVIRDVVFESESSILSRTEVDRLEPLHAFLRANPLIEVRIEGYGDGVKATERNANLSRDRAQAVGRALLVDLKVANAIAAVGAPMPQSVGRYRSVEITFISPARQNGDQSQR